MTNNDYLAHYGVKGMKWGVRRKKSKALFNYESRRSKLKKAKTDLSSMSDKELQNKLNRYNNEQKYLEIVGAKKQKSAFGKKMQEKSLEAVSSSLSKPLALAAGAATMAGYDYVRKNGLDALNVAALLYTAKKL